MSQTVLKIGRPAWRKSALWPKVIGQVVAGCATLLLVSEITLFALYGGELSPASMGETAFAYLGTMGRIGLGVILGGLAAMYLVERWQHQRANRAVNALVASSGDLLSGETICLYLRSFAASERFARRRILRSDLRDPETDLDIAVGDRCVLIAIGDRYDQRGALKLKSTDAQWEELFHNLADSARLIFCFMGSTPAARIEIAHLQAREDLFEKTVFIVPPEYDKATFEKLRVTAVGLGITLPHHETHGLAFRPSRGRRFMQILPYSQLMSELKDIDLGAPDVRRRIWRKSPFFDQEPRAS